MLKNSRTQELADSVNLKTSSAKQKSSLSKSILLIFAAFITFAFSFLAFAKQKIPDRVQDYKSVYPNSKYIAQRGSGDSAEQSKTEAISQIARYFQTSVNANLTTTLSSAVDETFKKYRRSLRL